MFFVNWIIEVSIEPRLFSHGNTQAPFDAGQKLGVFQLSHDFSVMEISMNCEVCLWIVRCFN